MRIAVISDIHGNALALEAVLEDLRDDQCDFGVCLGDVVQGGAQPADVLLLMRELGWPIVMGNADAWLLTGEETGEGPAPDWMREVREWSYSTLSDDDRAYVQGFQPFVDFTLPDGTILRCAHGTPSSFDEIILPETSDEEVQRLLGPIEGTIVCGGHTHTQQLRRLGESLFFNPGSVALPFNRQSGAAPPTVYRWAEYAMLTADEDGRVRVEFRHVPFDTNQIVATILASGMPHPERLTNRYPTV